MEFCQGGNWHKSLVAITALLPYASDAQDTDVEMLAVIITSVPTIFSIKSLTDGWLISLQASTYSSYASSFLQ